MIDLISGRTIDMIDSRKLENVVCWLKKFKNINIISRDGSNTYKGAINEALPDAVQVSDRFYLLQNLTLYAKKELNNKAKTTQAYLQKQKLIAKVKKEYKKVGSYRKVSRNLKINKATVKNYVEGFVPDRHKSKYSSLDRYKSKILKMIKDNQSIVDIHKQLTNKGLTTEYSNTRCYVNKLKTQLEFEYSSKILTHVETVRIFRREIIKLLYDRGLSDLNLTKREYILFKQFLNENKKLKSLLNLVTDFRIVLFSGDKNNLDPWRKKVENSKFKKLKTFAGGIKKDYDAVCNAIELSYSNGKIEGKINKLKKIKRDMYGRASFELLRRIFF